MHENMMQENMLGWTVPHPEVVHTLWVDLQSVGPWASSMRTLPPAPNKVMLLVTGVGVDIIGDLTRQQRRPIRWMGNVLPIECAYVTIWSGGEGGVPRRRQRLPLTRLPLYPEVAKLQIPYLLTPETWGNFGIGVINECAVRTPYLRIFLRANAIQAPQAAPLCEVHR